jgi:hypothetical protein
MNYADHINTLCWFQQIKKVTTLYYFVRSTTIDVFEVNWDLPLRLGIPHILEAILQK